MADELCALLPTTAPACLQETASGQALVEREESRCSLLLPRLLLLLLALRGPRRHRRRLLLLPLLPRVLRHLVPGLAMHVQRRKLDVQVRGEPVGRLQGVQQLRRGGAAQRVVGNLQGGDASGGGGRWVGGGGPSLKALGALVRLKQG